MRRNLTSVRAADNQEKKSPVAAVLLHPPFKELKMSSIKVFYLLVITTINIMAGPVHAQTSVSDGQSCAFAPPAPLCPVMVHHSAKNNPRLHLVWFIQRKKEKEAERHGGRALRKVVARRQGRLSYPILNPLKHPLPDINVTEPEVPFPNPGVMVSAVLPEEAA
jgi:hypothetical protein